jgi:hypothetical protein
LGQDARPPHHVLLLNVAAQRTDLLRYARLQLRDDRWLPAAA